MLNIRLRHLQIKSQKFLYQLIRAKCTWMHVRAVMQWVRVFDPQAKGVRIPAATDLSHSNR